MKFEDLDFVFGIYLILTMGRTGCVKAVLFTNLPFILGLFSAFNFLTSYLIFFENNLVRRFSLYRETRASLPPSPIATVLIPYSPHPCRFLTSQNACNIILNINNIN